MSSVQGPQTATDFAGFAQLRADAAQGGGTAAREAARQFEALFVQMMLQSMRSASDVFGDDTNKSYRDMFDQQVALEMTKGKGLGLADMLMRQLPGQAAADAGPQVRAPGAADLSTAVAPAAAADHARGLPRVPTAPRIAAMAPDPAEPALPDTVTRADWKPQGPLEFLRDLAPHAVQAAQRLGVSGRALLAQAALETGWGQNVVRDGAGVSSNNLFNIKAGAQWVGEQVRAKTLEFVDGITEQKTAAFRAYPDLAAAFEDYVRLLGSNPRYANAVRAGADPAAFASSLQQAGYATDPAYAAKLRSIVTSPRFESLIGQLKKLGNLPIQF